MSLPTAVRVPQYLHYSVTNAATPTCPQFSFQDRITQFNPHYTRTKLATYVIKHPSFSAANIPRIISTQFQQNNAYKDS